MDMQKTVDDNRNAITMQELEIVRIGKLKAQMEITISNLDNSKKEKLLNIEKLKAECDKFQKDKEVLFDERTTLKTEVKKLKEESDELQKSIDNRKVLANEKEDELLKRELRLNEGNKNLSDNISKNEEDTKAIESKKFLIKELISKL